MGSSSGLGDRCVVHYDGTRMWINGTEVTKVANLRVEHEYQTYSMSGGPPQQLQGIMVEISLMPDEILPGPPPPAEVKDLYDPGKDTEKKTTAPRKPRGVYRASNEASDATEREGQA